MNNPFDYIRQDRERREDEEVKKKRKQEEKLAEERALQNKRAMEERERREHAMDDAIKRFDGFVTETLELLMQSAFTESAEQRKQERWISGWQISRSGLSWSIGHSEIKTVPRGTEWDPYSVDEQVWVWEIKVDLVLDSSYAPLKFDVYRQSRRSQRKNPLGFEESVLEPIEAGLSQSELIEALKALYPLGNAG